VLVPALDNRWAGDALAGDPAGNVVSLIDGAPAPGQ